MTWLTNLFSGFFRSITGIFGFIALFFGMLFLDSPPKPEIKKAEFPLTLMYEIDGETKTVEDTMICQFGGFGANEGTMEKYRTWKATLKSKKKHITLCKDDGIEIYIEPCSQYAAAYFMGDKEICDELGENYPNVCQTTGSGLFSSETVFDEEYFDERAADAK